MAYASIEAVRKSAPQIEISGDSKPSDRDVQDYLDEIDANTNSALVNIGYVTPVTASQSIIILRDMVVQAAIARILRARLFGVADVSTSGAKEAQAYYDDRMKWLTDTNNPFELPDATRNDAAVIKPFTQILGEVDTDWDDDYGDGPRATMGQVF